MLRIRLSRIGKKGQPHYRIVVADHRKPVKGSCVEQLGSYNPANKALNAKTDRVTYWISVGAQPSQTVARLLKSNGMTGMEKFIKHITFTKKEEAVAEVEAVANNA